MEFVVVSCCWFACREPGLQSETPQDHCSLIWSAGMSLTPDSRPFSMFLAPRKVMGVGQAPDRNCGNEGQGITTVAS